MTRHNALPQSVARTIENPCPDKPNTDMEDPGADVQKATAGTMVGGLRAVWRFIRTIFPAAALGTVAIAMAVYGTTEGLVPIVRAAYTAQYPLLQAPAVPGLALLSPLTAVAILCAAAFLTGVQTKAETFADPWTRWLAPIAGYGLVFTITYLFLLPGYGHDYSAALAPANHLAARNAFDAAGAIFQAHHPSASLIVPSGAICIYLGRTARARYGVRRYTRETTTTANRPTP